MNKAEKIWWAYLAELLLSSLIVCLVVMIFGQDAVVKFARGIGLNLATLLSVAVFSAAFGMILLIFQKVDSPFYQWLEKKGGLRTYLNAFKYVAFVCLLSIFLVVFLSQNSSSKILALGTLFVLVLLGINTITFLNNVADLMRLEVAFRKKTHDPSDHQ